MKKPKGLTRAEKDAAYLRTFGQIDLEEDIALTAQEALQGPISPEGQLDTSEVFEKLPDQCPACGMGLAQGRPDIWSPMRFTKTAGFTFRVQCGLCAHTIYTTERAWQEVVDDRKARSTEWRPKPPKKEKRERGAE